MIPRSKLADKCIRKNLILQLVRIRLTKGQNILFELSEIFPQHLRVFIDKSGSLPFRPNDNLLRQWEDIYKASAA
jgi:hypothetical protein